MYEQDNEISITQLLLKIWAQRAIVATITVAAMLIAGVYAASKFMSNSTPSEYSLAVEFSFRNAEQGEYPNGQPFNLSDIVSNEVVAAVHRKLALEEQGISNQALALALTVKPYASNRNFIVAKYTSQLENSKLTQAEIAELERAFETELKAAANNAAEISLNTARFEGLDETVISNILYAIPTEWSRIRIQQYGVLNYADYPVQPLASSSYVDAEYIIGLFQISDSVRIMLAALEQMQKDTRLSVTFDPISSMSISDLVNRLRVVQRFEIDRLEKEIAASNVYRNKDDARLFFEGRQLELEDNIALMKAKVTVYDQSIAEFSRNVSGSVGRVPAGGEGVTAQFDEQFLNKLMTLNDDVSNAKFLQEMIQSRLDMQVKLQEMEGEIRTVNRFLSLIEREGGASLSEAVNDKYLELMRAVEDLQQIYQRFVASAKASQLGSDGALYTTAMDQPSKSDPIRAIFRQVVIVGLALTFLGFCLGLLVALIKMSIDDEHSHFPEKHD